MRILVVDEEIPFPLNSGKRLRTFNLLKHLSSRHEIFFVCRQHEDEKAIEAGGLEDEGINVQVVPHMIRKKAGLNFYTALFANIFSRYPYSVTSHYSRLFEATIVELMREKQFDLIHCEWTPYAVNLKKVLPFPSVIAAHNVESMIWRRNYEVEQNLLKKLYIYFQWKKMELFEKKTYGELTRTVAVSLQDKNVIAQWIPGDLIDVVENGVDIDYFNTSKTNCKANSLVFSASMDWRPNVDGMLYFLDKIWPLVLELFPDSTLTIVGRSPMKVLKDKIANLESVTLTGTVKDVRPYIENASVYIVPLRIGGGSRLKILEAFSMRKPVVSTSVGAEGLEVESGRDLIIADDPHTFVSAIERLFQDSVLRERLGGEGRTLVEAKYQWEILSEKLEKTWIKASERYGIN